MDINIKCTPKEFRQLINGDMVMNITRDGIIYGHSEEANKQNKAVDVDIDIMEQPKREPSDHKPRTKKQQDDINAIKAAYFAKTGRKTQENSDNDKTQGSGRKKKINDAYVIAEHDHNNRAFSDIAKEYGVCPQTIINHYNAEMERRKK